MEKGFLFTGMLLAAGFIIHPIFGGNVMELSSSAFKDKEKIPIQYVMPGAGGKNISAPLAWKNVPAGTKSFALSMVDPHPVAQNWVHCGSQYSSQATFIEEGMKKMPAEAVELKTLWRPDTGPQPPKGREYFVFALFALNVKLDLGESSLWHSRRPLKT
jgi:phosphatidylethanolamine-binding protein (PEBP) family uncharacterized protein